jgi:hypothetical protein
MQDYARSHVAIVVRDFLSEKGTSLLHQPPYSPDVKICDRFLFRNLEHAQTDMQFDNDDEPLFFVTNHFKSHSHKLLQHKYEQLKADVVSIINADGNYLLSC